jgi:hypothetical protein
MAHMASHHSQNPPAPKNRHGLWDGGLVLVGAMGPRDMYCPLAKSDRQGTL